MPDEDKVLEALREQREAEERRHRELLAEVRGGAGPALTGVSARERMRSGYAQSESRADAARAAGADVNAQNAARRGEEGGGDDGE